MKALLAMPSELVGQMFTAQQRQRLESLVDVDVTRTVPDLAAADDGELQDVEVLITGWGSPLVDAAALERMPHLRAIVHTAGTVRFVVSDAVWEQGNVRVTSATASHSAPVSPSSPGSTARVPPASR